MIVGSDDVARRAVRARSVPFKAHFDDRNVRFDVRGSVRVGVALDEVDRRRRVTLAEARRRPIA
jgi:hypothetical protein